MRRVKRRTGTSAVIGYARVSTAEQADSGLGLEAQRRAIRSECERRGWELVGIEEDAGWSGKVASRPGLLRALEACKSGQADGLVVAKLDRLSRSVQQAAALLAEAEHEGWALVALDLGVDLSTPSGEVMAHVLAAIAQFERRLIGQRTKDALAVLRAQGVRLGRPQVNSQQVVARIASEREAGRTLQAIADGLNRDGIATAHGGAAWWPSTVGKVLEGAEAA
ncbi:MAG TPA: recombinase family protein [Candidatus Micrarchaeaceae archaeon]|nr:recombinase family protein [Candidatus Micrarchaeaceae archaeon]